MAERPRESLWGSVAEVLQQEKSSVQAPYIDDIIHSMNDILIVIDHNAKVVMVNEAALRFLGYTEDELLGTPFWGILAEEMSGVMNDIMIGNVEKTLLAKTAARYRSPFLALSCAPRTTAFAGSSASPRTSPSANGWRRRWRGAPNSWPNRMCSWSSSPTSPPTIFRNRCA